MPDEYVVLTRELLHAGKTGSGGFTRAQTDALSVAWPLRKGWLSALIGKRIPLETYRLFLSLRGQTRSSARAKAKLLQPSLFEG